MKRILIALFALTMICALTLPVLAAEEEVTRAVATASTVAGATGIGVLLFTAILFIITKLKWFKSALSSIANAFSAVFGKDDKIESLPNAIESVKESFNAAKEDFKKILEEEKAKFDSLEAQYKDQVTETNNFKQAFAMLCIYANNINPFIKNEIFRLIKGEIPFQKTIEETAKCIEEFATKAQSADVKIDTPCLNLITKE